MNDLSLIDDKELYQKLQQAGIAERLRTSQEWKLLAEASKRIVDRAIDKFALVTKADDVVGIIELQTIIKKYKYGLFSEIEQLAQEGERAFQECKERGLIDRPGEEGSY